MHIEGAECIDDNFYNLEALYRSGLRSIGPVWSRPTIFGEGVPFAFPILFSICQPKMSDNAKKHPKPVGRHSGP